MIRLNTLCRVAAAVVVLSILGCKDDAPAPTTTTPTTTPTTTTPTTTEAAPVAPDLTAVPTVKTVMWTLVEKTNAISPILDKGPPLAPADKAILIATVDDLVKLAGGLEVDVDAQKHWKVARGLPEFQATLKAAQAALVQDPVPMKAVQDIRGTCQACHNRGKAETPFKW